MTTTELSNTTNSSSIMKGRSLIKVAIALLVALPFLAALVPSSSFTTFLGRFHPMILHFPIGFIVGLLMIEGYNFLRPSKNLEPAAWLFLLASLGSALIACILGLFLSWSGSYDAEILSDHQWMGFGVATSTLILVLFKWKLKTNSSSKLLKSYQGGLVFVVMLISAAGHHGGALTHGSSYLTEHAPGWMPKPMVAMLGTVPAKLEQDDSVYVKTIHPLLQENCNNCHGNSKQEGELRLDQPENFATLKGESGEAAIVPGNAMASAIVRAITLPQDHDDVMPPSNKKPLRHENIMDIIHWIDNGALTTSINTSVPKNTTLLKETKKNMGEYATKIWPIIKKRCVSCHGPKTAKKKKNPRGGLRLDTPDWVKRGVVKKGEKDSPVIVAKDLKNSSFYQLIILDEDDDDIMPPKGKPLKKEEIALIKKWIEEGAQFND